MRLCQKKRFLALIYSSFGTLWPSGLLLGGLSMTFIVKRMFNIHSGLRALYNIMYFVIDVEANG